MRLLHGPADRIQNGGGSIVVNADGSVSITPASNKPVSFGPSHIVYQTGVGFPLVVNVNAQLSSIRVNNIQFAPGDLLLERDAANTLAQRNGTSAQTFRVYNTFTDTSNLERGGFRWSSNVLEVFTDALGTGTSRAIRLVPAGAMMLRGLFASSAGAPTTTEFPTSGDWGLHKNTGTGTVSLVYNDGGTIKTVALA